MGNLIKGGHYSREETIFHLLISSYGEINEGGKLIKGGFVMYLDLFDM